MVQVNGKTAWAPGQRSGAKVLTEEIELPRRGRGVTASCSTDTATAETRSASTRTPRLDLGKNPVVATLSFGSDRDFVLKHRETKERLAYRLGHGSLLAMGGTSQHRWVHAVPKTKEAVGERISLTFRYLIGAAE